MEPSLTGLEAMYLAALIGAGVTGAITLFAPGLAARYVFAGDTQVGVYLKIVGAIWLAIGLIAIAGLLDPMRYLAILLLQLVYKSTWLICAAYPALLNGRTTTGLTGLTVLFTVWVIALLAFVPFQALFSSLS